MILRSLSILLFVCLPALAISQPDQHTKPHPVLLSLGKLDQYLKLSLDDVALADFETIVAKVKNNIFWTKEGEVNKYQNAFKQSSYFFKHLLRDDVPAFVFLIPYLESGWQPALGKPDSDYGYWQMVNAVVVEIKTLDEASDALSNAHPDRIRSDPELSTEAALIHIKRYYFYYRHVAHYSEAEAWMFSVIAFNWGAGNVNTLLSEMRDAATDDSSSISFADFYHYLYQSSEQYPSLKSMRVALEYLPNLWNIALLLDQAAHNDSVKSSLTRRKSSAVSTP